MSSVNESTHHLPSAIELCHRRQLSRVQQALDESTVYALTYPPVLTVEEIIYNGVAR